MAKLSLSAPWVIYYRELLNMFKNDPEVVVVFDEDSMTIKIYVDVDEKAEILSRLLPGKKTFGRTSIDIKVYCANKKSLPTELPETIDASVFEKLFKGNPAFAFAKTIPDIFMQGPVTFVVFVPEVVQFYVDDLMDLHGLRSTLYADMAKDLFPDIEHVFFNTDKLFSEDF